MSQLKETTTTNASGPRRDDQETGGAGRSNGLKGLSYEAQLATLTPAAEEEAAAPETYTVQSGDTLSKIARRVYGDPGRWREIAEANGMANPNLLQVGQVLVIPGTSSSTTPSGNGAASGAGADAGSAGGSTAGSSSETSGGQQGATDSTSGSTAASGETGEAQGESAAGEADTSTEGLTLTITDGYALLRNPPPDFGSLKQTIKAGTQVRILEEARKDGKRYVRVAEVSAEGGEAQEKELGWTSKANLSGYEGGGSDKNYDSSLQPDDPITLEKLSGTSKKMAMIYNQRGKYIKDKASSLSIASESAAAVLQVESNGKGFADDDRMIIRFENHIFWDEWGKNNAETFRKHFKYNSGKRWTGHSYREDPNGEWVSFHGNQSKEWKAFEFARSLSEDAAMKSISMGMAQIMGFNHSSLGFSSVKEMFDQMAGSVKPQLDGMFEFIKNNATCMGGLKAKNYTKFASGYNGSGQAEHYGSLIKSAAEAYAAVTKGRKHA